jgi:hypothetical protein
LLLLTSYVGLILFATIAVFMLLTARGRALLGSVEPWLAGVVVVAFGFPHLIWLDAQGSLVAPVLDRLGGGLATSHLVDRAGLPARILVAHAGLIVLVALAAGWGVNAAQRVPVFQRPAVHPFARYFIYTFAIAPLVIATLLALVLGEPNPVGGVAPLIVLSALAVVVFAGDTISINRDYLLGIVWGAMLVAPPVIVALAIVVVPPITGFDIPMTQPAKAIGRYFSEAFSRRTGHVLEIATGEPRLAALVALTSRPRASLYLDATPRRSPWIDAHDVSQKGAVVVWTAPDTAGPPPDEIKARFPTLAPDVPRAFERFTLTGKPTLRIGWGVVRPGGQ